MTEQWQCTMCKLWNTYKRDSCQACFTISKSVKHKFRLTVCRLHHKIRPEAQALKEFLVSGYATSCTASLIPIDIIVLCQRYYDEIMHWKIESTDLIQHINSLSAYTKDDKYYSNLFCVEDVKIKCSFDLNSKLYGKPGFNSFSFHVFLPKYIERMTLYIESYCKQNRAEFKNRSTFFNRSYDDWNWMIEDDEIREYKDMWSESTHYMKLNWKEHNALDFSYYIDILSIKYRDRDNYIKSIRMKKKNHFKWYIDGEFMNECRNSIGTQLFFSDTFDDENNNWCLRIQPMGSSMDMPLENRKALLMLKLLKKPSIEHCIQFKVIVSNTCNDMKKEHFYNFNGFNTSCHLGELFSSTKLFEISSFTVEVEIEVYLVNGDREFEDKYADIFY